uniref:Uncharacterized protein n=1 Tax=Candidozyma auris TaxID=498019 RepID=A0A0L0NX57_CANAR
MVEFFILISPLLGLVSLQQRISCNFFAAINSPSFGVIPIMLEQATYQAFPLSPIEIALLSLLNPIFFVFIQPTKPFVHSPAIPIAAVYEVPTPNVFANSLIQLKPAPLMLFGRSGTYKYLP